MSNEPLPITEELDFHYLLGLMPPLHDVPEFAWLPELFTTIGYESFLKLCKYAGGETIRIPTLDELTISLRALQYFYNVFILGKQDVSTIPTEIVGHVKKIHEVYNARDDAKDNQESAE